LGRRVMFSIGLMLGGASLYAEDAPRVPPIDERIKQLADDAPLAMEFRGTTAAECRKWQTDFAAKLRALLGPHAPPVRWKTVVERSVQLTDHRRDEVLLTAEGYPPLPLYLLVPNGKTDRPRRGILAIHGHGNFGYDPVAGKDDQPAAAVPCLTPFGRRLGDRAAYGKQDPCAVTFVRLQLLGKVLMAENLRDCLWALEYLAHQEGVDAERLGCVGLSYGGRMAMLTTALEPRIRVAVVSGALNVMQERVGVRYSCGAQVIPGLLQYGDVPEIAGLIAPRPCLWEVGKADGLVSPVWAEKALTRIRRAYKAQDAEDKLHVDRFEGGHQWNGVAAYPLLQKVLGR
jgi:dienelactone hydrolase